MDRENDVLVEMMIEKLLDHQGFSSWFDQLSNETVEQIYYEVNEAISCWLDGDDCYEMDEV